MYFERSKVRARFWSFSFVQEPLHSCSSSFACRISSVSFFQTIPILCDSLYVFESIAATDFAELLLSWKSIIVFEENQVDFSTVFYGLEKSTIIGSFALRILSSAAREHTLASMRLPQLSSTEPKMPVARWLGPCTKMLVATFCPTQLNFFLANGLVATFHLDSGKSCSFKRRVSMKLRNRLYLSYPLNNCIPTSTPACLWYSFANMVRRKKLHFFSMSLIESHVSD